MKKTIFYLTILLVLLSSCGLRKQISEMQNFAKCEFRLKTIEDINVANVNVQKVKSISDLNFMDAALITASLAKGTLPLSLTLNVEAKNPNTSQAAMNKMEWILLIDKTEIVEGVLNERIVIPPSGGSSIIPLHIKTDLSAVLKKSGSELLGYGFGLTGSDNTSTRITLKVKPTIMIGKVPITYPGYISVSKEFTSK